MKPQIQLIRISIKILYFFITSIQTRQNWEWFDREVLTPCLRDAEKAVEQIENKS